MTDCRVNTSLRLGRVTGDFDLDDSKLSSNAVVESEAEADVGRRSDADDPS